MAYDRILAKISQHKNHSAITVSSFRWCQRKYFKLNDEIFVVKKIYVYNEKKGQNK